MIHNTDLGCALDDKGLIRPNHETDTCMYFMKVKT